MLKPATFTLSLALLAACAGSAVSQPRPQEQPVELPLRVGSAEIVRFPTPIRLDGQEPYAEALVLTLLVPRRSYEAASTSLQPFLYVGSVELYLFAVKLDENPQQVAVTVHVRDWERLDEGAPMVLTHDRGAPQRAPQTFNRRQDLPRFTRQWIVDRR